MPGMKKLMLISFGFLLNLTAFCQLPAPGSYTPNSNVDKLVGTWKWVSGNDVVEIKFHKLRHTVTVGNYDIDLLLGSHAFIKDGIVIESSMSDFTSIPLDHKKNTVYISNTELGPDNFEGRLSDLTKNKSVVLQLLFIPGNPAQVAWHIEPAEIASTDPNFQYGVTLPRDIILIKQ
jgi:hypothetical protein